MDRREFLKTIGAGIVGAACGNILMPSSARALDVSGVKEFHGILVDTTRCIGCRRCEKGCAEVNNLPIPDISDDTVLEKKRGLTETRWTVVNGYDTENGRVFVTRRCMHCNQPACVAACLVKAMKKTKEGPVIWNTNCMGCRYCMISCPFDVPQFEHDTPIPKLQKCILCWERLKEGKLPGCVEACPTEALIFGTRRKLLEEGKRRIYQNSGKYVHHIYGEYEVGGTSHLYLSAVPFEQIGFRTDLGTTAYPEFTTGFLYAVPFVLVLWPALLLGISRATKREEKKVE
ncbi:MAG: 4Fe-4S dicluster domain-containing protein [Pseudomonadota bacterium]